MGPTPILATISSDDSNYRPLLSDIVNEVRNKRLLPFLGAGISVDPPSRLPQATTLVKPLVDVLWEAGQMAIKGSNVDQGDLDLKNKVPFVAILVMVLIFISIIYHPPFILFSMFALYTLSGLFGYIYRKIKKIK